MGIFKKKLEAPLPSPDFRAIVYGKDSDIEIVPDWEQRRYEIAKAVIAGIEVNSQATIESDCKMAVEIADEMIKQLKEKK